MGRLSSMSDGTGSASYSYGPLGEVTQMNKVIAGTSYPVQYGYNLAGELTQITYASGRVVTQAYDPAGRLNQISSAGTSYFSQAAYNAGEALGFRYGNGVQASMTYNTRLQLATLRYYTGSGDLLNLTYGYALGSADNGQIQSITDNLDATKSLTYSYDALSRLQYASAGSTPTWKLGFIYDRYGNRTNENLLAGSGPGGTWAYDVTTNRLGMPYAYDAAGNMTSDSFNSYAFDAENRITQAVSAGATYSYDGNGLRVQKTAGGATTTYIFSGTKVIAEYTGGALSKEYIHAGSQLLATVDAVAGTTSYQHPDHLSTRVETGADGGPTRTFGHFPFGEVWYETGMASKWKFTSYERDGEGNLDYATARHYADVLGRFMSPDPLAGVSGNPQLLNRYAYVLNNPISYVDPSGLRCVPGTPGYENDCPLPSGEGDLSFLSAGAGGPFFIGRLWDDLFVCRGQKWCENAGRAANNLNQLLNKLSTCPAASAMVKDLTQLQASGKLILTNLGDADGSTSFTGTISIDSTNGITAHNLGHEWWHTVQRNEVLSGARAGAIRSGQGPILGAIYGQLIWAGARSLNSLDGVYEGTPGFGALDKEAEAVGQKISGACGID